MWLTLIPGTMLCCSAVAVPLCTYHRASNLRAREATYGSVSGSLTGDTESLVGCNSYTLEAVVFGVGNEDRRAHVGVAVLVCAGKERGPSIV